MNKYDYIYVFLISFIPQLIILLLSPPILFWDEYSYLDNVKHVLLNTPYFEYYRFPLLWWILIPISYITNFNIFFIKLFLIFVFSLSTVFLYKILEEYDNKYINYILILFYSLNGLFLIWASRIYPDVLASSLLIFSIYFYIKYFKDNRERNLILYSLFSVLSILTKYEYGLWLISSIIFLKNKDKLKTILYSFLFSIPYFLYNLILYHNPIFIFIKQAEIVYTYTSYQPLSLFLSNLFIFSSAYLFSLLQNPKKLENYNKSIYLYIILSIIFLAFFTKAKDARYILMLLPPFLILTRIFINKIKGLQFPYLFLFSLLNIMPIYYGIAFLINYNTNLGNTYLNYVYRASEYLKQYNPKVILTNVFWPMVAYYTNSQVYIMYNATYLIPRVYPQFIIYSPNCGTPFPFNPNDYNISLIYYYVDPNDCQIYIYKVNSYFVK
ncbi:MAG: glycosyltransferase family 39 protein [Candidatus Nanopusillus sp.]|nr:glycosyltransferase family 39 protein [Candidatus Nanopusillus sp.]